MPSSLSYKKSGVDIDAGNELVKRIKTPIKSTFSPRVLQGIGGFGALYEFPVDRYQSPVLVSSTDGVGTKLKLAHQLDQHNTIGIDLVAMCVNDIVVCGAEPLYFLDYFATAKLDVDRAEQVINGIVEGCKLAGCVLSGGETAEMPGMYQPGDYDLAGFAVGVVEKQQIITGDNVSPGDVVIGLSSSGPHSNGYSLIRRIIDRSACDLNESITGVCLGQSLLAPTKIYVKSILSLLRHYPVKSICHITGGGITENLPRVLSDNVTACISRSALPSIPIFQWLKQQGNIAEDEMLRTFNCGIGMTLCVEKNLQKPISQLLSDLGETVIELGEISEWKGKPVVYSA